MLILIIELDTFFPLKTNIIKSTNTSTTCLLT